jgi:hypothetical protein
MSIRACLCGADVDIKQATQETADGESETLYWVSCPVCGQIGPKISGKGKDEQSAIAEAIAAWNKRMNDARPL